MGGGQKVLMGAVGVSWASELLVAASCWAAGLSEDGGSKQEGDGGGLITREDESKDCADRLCRG